MENEVKRRLEVLTPTKVFYRQVCLKILRPVEFCRELIQLIELALQQRPDFPLLRVHRRPRSGSGCGDSDVKRPQPVRVGTV
jgi:hypothetical protein